jgi:hypothetical protein
MKRPTGITIIAALYFVGAAGYAAMLLLWLVARDTLIGLVERISPTASLAPALLGEMAGVVTIYFLLMACFCATAGNGLWRLQAWSWFVTIGFVCISLVFDAILLVRIFGHIPSAVLVAGVLRLVFLGAVVWYLGKTKTRSAFGLTRSRTETA